MKIKASVYRTKLRAQTTMGIERKRIEESIQVLKHTELVDETELKALIAASSVTNYDILVGFQLPTKAAANAPEAEKKAADAARAAAIAAIKDLAIEGALPYMGADPSKEGQLKRRVAINCIVDGAEISLRNTDPSEIDTYLDKCETLVYYLTATEANGKLVTMGKDDLTVNITKSAHGYTFRLGSVTFDEHMNSLGMEAIKSGKNMKTYGSSTLPAVVQRALDLGVYTLEGTTRAALLESRAAAKENASVILGSARSRLMDRMKTKEAVGTLADETA
jgi:hypothetical protein